MFPLKRTNDLAVVDITSIERAVQVIPKFHRGIASTKLLYDAWQSDMREHERDKVLDRSLRADGVTTFRSVLKFAGASRFIVLTAARKRAKVRRSGAGTDDSSDGNNSQSVTIPSKR
jgi:hypothetical protein